MEETQSETKKQNIARLLLKEKVVQEMEIGETIPTRMIIPSINYIEDPTDVQVKFYNLVFYISNVRTEDNKTIIEYRFRGVEEIR